MKIFRLSCRLSPAGIVPGYILALFVSSVAAVALPFSSISMGVFGSIVVAFLVVALPVTVVSPVEDWRSWVEMGYRFEY